MKNQSAPIRSHGECFQLRLTLQQSPWLSPLESPSCIPHQSCHRGPSRSLPILAAKTCGMRVQLGQIKHSMEHGSLRENNECLPAVKPQIAPRQIWFWTLFFRWQIIVFKLSGLPFHGHGASDVNLELCHDFIQFCYCQPFNIHLAFTSWIFYPVPVMVRCSLQIFV